MQAEQRRAYEHGRLVRVSRLRASIFLNASLKSVGPTVRESADGVDRRHRPFG